MSVQAIEPQITGTLRLSLGLQLGKRTFGDQSRLRCGQSRELVPIVHPAADSASTIFRLPVVAPEAAALMGGNIQRAKPDFCVRALHRLNSFVAPRPVRIGTTLPGRPARAASLMTPAWPREP